MSLIENKEKKHEHFQDDLKDKIKKLCNEHNVPDIVPDLTHRIIILDNIKDPGFLLSYIKIDNRCIYIGLYEVIKGEHDKNTFTEKYKLTASDDEIIKIIKNKKDNLRIIKGEGE